MCVCTKSGVGSTLGVGGPTGEGEVGVAAGGPGGVASYRLAAKSRKQK